MPDRPRVSRVLRGSNPPRGTAVPGPGGTLDSLSLQELGDALALDIANRVEEGRPLIDVMDSPPDDTFNYERQWQDAAPQDAQRSRQRVAERQWQNGEQNCMNHQIFGVRPLHQTLNDRRLDLMCSLLAKLQERRRAMHERITQKYNQLNNRIPLTGSITIQLQLRHKAQVAYEKLRALEEDQRLIGTMLVYARNGSSWTCDSSTTNAQRMPRVLDPPARFCPDQYHLLSLTRYTLGDLHMYIWYCPHCSGQIVEVSFPSSPLNVPAVAVSSGTIHRRWENVMHRAWVTGGVPHETPTPAQESREEDPYDGCTCSDCNRSRRITGERVIDDPYDDTYRDQ